MHSFIYGVCGVLGFVVVLYLLLFVQCTVVVFSIMVQSFHRIRLKCKKLMTTDDIMAKVHKIQSSGDDHANIKGRLKIWSQSWLPGKNIFLEPQINFFFFFKF
jgi:hypothetical protein